MSVNFPLSQKSGVMSPHPVQFPFRHDFPIPGLHPLVTCAELSKDLHGLIKTLLAEEVEGIQVFDVMDLLLLLTVRVIFHFLIREQNR